MSAVEANEDLAREIERLGPWFHNLEIRGIQTAPDHFLGNYPAFKWDRFKHIVPQDLEGRSVLDIGCNAGFYCLEMKRRGAGRVVGLEHDPHYLEQAQFAAYHTGLEIEFQQMSVYDIAQLSEKFDLVIFMGVLYHLRYPMLALDLIHEHVAGDLVLFQSMQRGEERLPALAGDYSFEEWEIFDRPEFPKLFFVEERFAGDPTNWWIPNRAATEAMLRSAGFIICEHPEREVYLCERGKRPQLVDPPLDVRTVRTG
jgi:tRNA (mo5U34)-methyltransferase